jgi:acetylornithine deacetylase/succinyl-diaminopimelate desuccinylase-like protein
MWMTPFESYIKQNRVRFTSELAQFCRQPSIASTGEGIDTMAEMVADRLRHLGAVTRVFTVDRSHPYVYGEIGSGPRTLLLYNHYDVQPARREDGWSDDPFEPVLRDGRLYARGVADNKANMLFRIHAVETYLAAYGTLPLRVRFFIEGEEEIGSPHLQPFVDRYNGLLQADGCIWESGRKGSEGRPLLQLGVRGILYLELSIRGHSREMHSSWANIAQNPALGLLERLRCAVASLTDEDERPTFGNLMDDVPGPSPADLALMDAIPFDLASFQRNTSATLRPGLDRRAALKRLFFEPTCTLCGLRVGYAGPGTKTVIPNSATAKIDMRLPPGLTPDNVEARLRKHLADYGFGDIVVTRLGGLQPARTSPSAPVVLATSAAVRSVYGVDPIVHPSMSASGPMYELCASRGVPAVTYGAGHPGDNVHGTDENIYMDDYFQAIRTMGAIMRNFGEQGDGGEEWRMES